MKRQPYPVSQLTGGKNVYVDAVFLTDKESPNLRLVTFSRGCVVKDKGWHTFGQGLPLTGTVMLIDTLPKADGAIFYIIITTRYFYRYNSTSDSYENKNSTSPFSGTEDDRFSAVVTQTSAGADIFVVTNGVDPIKKWDGGVGDITNLEGWDTANIKAKSLAVFKSRLIAGGTVESGYNCPQRVRWTVVGDPEDVTGPGSGFVDIVATPDWIVTLVTLKNRLFVFKERSIWELPYVGGTDVFGAPVLRVEGVGTYSPHSVITLGEELIFFGTDNVYLYDGVDLVPIGKNIYPLLYETASRVVDADKIKRTAASYIEELKEYWLVVCGKGSDVPNIFMKYSFDHNAWTWREDAKITAFGFYSTPGAPRWTDLTGTWNAQTWRWMDRPLTSGAPTTLIGDHNGYVYEDDRMTTTTAPMSFETKDWIFAHAQRLVEIRVEAKGGPFTVFLSPDQGKTWTLSKEFPATADFYEHKWYINYTCQMFRLRFDTTAETFELKWVEPWYIPRGRGTS